jgi:hypothetical protein
MRLTRRLAALAHQLQVATNLKVSRGILGELRIASRGGTRRSYLKRTTTRTYYTTVLHVSNYVGADGRDVGVYQTINLAYGESILIDANQPVGGGIGAKELNGLDRTVDEHVWESGRTG